MWLFVSEETITSSLYVLHHKTHFHHHQYHRPVVCHRLSRPKTTQPSVIDHGTQVHNSATDFSNVYVSWWSTCHLDIDILIQRQLHVRRPHGDSHCLLHSWAMSSGQQTANSWWAQNAVTYQQAGVDLAQLERYVSDRSYILNSVDAVLNILCNAYHVAAFIIGQKFLYSQDTVIPVPGKTTNMLYRYTVYQWTTTAAENCSALRLHCINKTLC